ncbi:hypothetical protein HanIR_Chr16g0789921 [Helianthus annuus]|nr:hypothetical protein HanIR_Chr16g0789921 [Helianthus annuus]
MKEQLIHIDSTFFYPLSLVNYFHFLQLLLHCSHTLTLLLYTQIYNRSGKKLDRTRHN